MKLSGNYLKRYREIAGLFWKYGRSDLFKRLSSELEVAGIPEGDVQPKGEVTPEQLVDDLEALGPTYVKLGQVLASRPDLIPEAYTRALARLQNKVKPFPFEDVERTIHTALGVRISKAFSTFEPRPVAAASLGQVHQATLRDGRAVVVKVQRPNIRPQIAEDFDALHEIACLLDHTSAGEKYRFTTVVDDFRSTILQELNYLREAQNLITVGENLREFEHIVVPQPVMDYTRSTVLTMDYVRGTKVTSIGPLARLDLDGAVLVDEMFRAYLKQVLVDGIFHADPHPGNVFYTDDGRLALLDLGMVGHTGPGMQDDLLKLIMAVSDGEGETAAELVARVSEKLENYDASEFRRRISHLVALHRDQGLNQIKVGQTLLQVARTARNNGLFVPTELTLLGKTLMQLDEIGRILDPSFDPNASVRRNATELMSRRVKRDLTKGSFFNTFLELKDFLGALPARLNRLIDAFGDGDFEVKVKAVDAKTVLDGMQKIANRITCGVILAALIVGASLLMRVQTPFELFGYPGLAILCFLGAALGGLYLVISIFVQDYKSRKKLKLSR